MSNKCSRVPHFASIFTRRIWYGSILEASSQRTVSKGASEDSALWAASPSLEPEVQQREWRQLLSFLCHRCGPWNHSGKQAHETLPSFLPTASERATPHSLSPKDRTWGTRYLPGDLGDLYLLSVLWNPTQGNEISNYPSPWCMKH